MLRETNSMLHLLIDRFLYLRAVSMIVCQFLKCIFVIFFSLNYVFQGIFENSMDSFGW